MVSKLRIIWKQTVQPLGAPNNAELAETTPAPPPVSPAVAIAVEDTSGLLGDLSEDEDDYYPVGELDSSGSRQAWHSAGVRAVAAVRRHEQQAQRSTGAWPYNRPCVQQYVGKSQSCMVISGR